MIGRAAVSVTGTEVRTVKNSVSMSGGLAVVRGIGTVTADIRTVKNCLDLVNESMLAADMKTNTSAADIGNTIAIVAGIETGNIHSV